MKKNITAVLLLKMYLKIDLDNFSLDKDNFKFPTL